MQEVSKILTALIYLDDSNYTFLDDTVNNLQNTGAEIMLADRTVTCKKIQDFRIYRPGQANFYEVMDYAFRETDREWLLVLNAGDTVTPESLKIFPDLLHTDCNIINALIVEEDYSKYFTEVIIEKLFYARIFEKPLFVTYTPVLFNKSFRFAQKISTREIVIKRKVEFKDKTVLTPLNNSLKNLIAETEQAAAEFAAKTVQKNELISSLSDSTRQYLVSNSHQAFNAKVMDGIDSLKEKYAELYSLRFASRQKILALNKTLAGYYGNREIKLFEDWYYHSVLYLLDDLNDIGTAMKILFELAEVFPDSVALFTLLYKGFSKTGNFPACIKIAEYIATLAAVGKKTPVRMPFRYFNQDYLTFLKLVLHYYCGEYEASAFYSGQLKEAGKYMEGYYQIKAVIEGNFSIIRELEEQSEKPVPGLFSVAFTYLRLAREYIREGNYRKAAENYELSYKNAVKEKNTYLVQAFLADITLYTEKLPNYEKLKRFSAGVPIDPAFSWYWYCLGKTARDKDLAESLFLKALSVEEAKAVNIMKFSCNPEAVTRQLKNNSVLNIIFNNVPSQYLTFLYRVELGKESVPSAGKEKTAACKKSWQIINQAFSLFNVLQIKEELAEYLKEADRLKPKTVVEIGSYDGGTLYSVARVSAPDALIIGIDLDFHREEHLIDEIHKFNPEQKIQLLRADSHDAGTPALLKKILQDRKIDLLFIDGDHSYTGVKQDYEMYSPMVNKNGLIVFHDIKMAVSVNKLWNEVKSGCRHREITSFEYQDGLGIGILYL